MHVTLLEGRNGSPALKHMEILGYTHRHPLFTREPAVTASAPQAPSFTGQLRWDIFEYQGLQASCFLIVDSQLDALPRLTPLWC